FHVTGVQTCALPISRSSARRSSSEILSEIRSRVCSISGLISLWECDMSGSSAADASEQEAQTQSHHHRLHRIAPNDVGGLIGHRDRKGVVEGSGGGE